MSWQLTYIKKASNDLRRLDGNQKRAVLKAILRVSQNPLPTSEGGYGKPLGNRSGTRLAGLLKIKLKDQGLRVVYQLYSSSARNAHYHHQHTRRRASLRRGESTHGQTKIVFYPSQSLIFRSRNVTICKSNARASPRARS